MQECAVVLVRKNKDSLLFVDAVVCGQVCASGEVRQAHEHVSISA